MPWYAVAAGILVVLAPSVWTGALAGLTALSLMVLAVIGAKMHSLGLAKYLDPRTRPFGLARDYAHWCEVNGRRPVWLFVLLPLWAGYAVALLGSVIVTLGKVLAH